MFTQEVIITIVTTMIGSGLINCILTHFLYSNKLKKEIEIKNNGMIAEKVLDSLLKFRDMELMLTTTEIYDVETELENNGARVDLINANCAVYPAVFNDKESLFQFVEKIRECRSEYEKYLPCKLALNLVFIERYMMKAVLFASGYSHKNLLPTIGAFLIFDLQKWQRRMDKLLVKELNKVNFNLEVHNGIKWNLLRKKEVEKQWERTLLYYFIEGKTARRKRNKMKFSKRMFDKAISSD